MGLVIALTRAHPILVTLSMMIFLRGLGEFLTRGGDISGCPSFIAPIGHGSVLGIPVPLLILIGCVLACHVLLSRTKLGFSAYMVGSNIESARYSGINTRKVLVLVYVLSGVIFGGIGERTGVPPTEAEYDNIAKALDAAAKHARTHGIQLGVEAVNRYENHLINSAQRAVVMVERAGAENIFVHLDTYHMNIEEKGAANGILIARDHLKYIHLSESDRGTPAMAMCRGTRSTQPLPPSASRAGLPWRVSSTCRRRLPMVWRPVARDMEEVMGNGLPFLRNNAEQYSLI